MLYTMLCCQYPVRMGLVSDSLLARVSEYVCKCS